MLGVRYTRPAYAAIEADDLESSANHALNCMTPSELWSKFLNAENAKQILACLNSLSEDVDYTYVARAQPELAIENDSGKKSCLGKLMPSVPLPREIYFLALAGTRKTEDVYSMSFDTTSRSSHRIEFKFPLKLHLESTTDLEFWLVTSIFSLFETHDKMLASLVPELVVNQCFKGDPQFQDKKSANISPAYWP